MKALQKMRAKSQPTPELAGRKKADTERRTDGKRQEPGAVKTTLTKRSTPAVRGGHTGRERKGWGRVDR